MKTLQFFAAMRLTIVNSTAKKLSVKNSIIQIGKLIDSTIGTLKGQVNVIICEDKEIQKLNRDYRGKDKPTNVLSFTYFSGEKTLDDELLGEVFLDIEEIQRQDEDLNTLCIHGLLHLRGYDHEKDRDYRTMKLLEEKIMKSFSQSTKK